MKKIAAITAVLVAATVCCLGSSAWSQSLKEATTPVPLIAAGSGVNLGITRLLAEAFRKEHPQVPIDVPGSIGTRGAIQAVAEKAISLGLISRPLKEEEKALGMVAQPYARTAIVIGAHPSVQDDDISSQEYVEIIRGTKNQWQDGNEIIVQIREKSDSGFRVLEDNIPGFKKVYTDSQEAKRWVVYFTDQEANHALATIPAAIGVTDMGMISTDHLRIKVLKLNGIEPTTANVLNGTYPLHRQLSFLYLQDTLSEDAKAFLEFVGSEAGRHILQANGYIPVQ